METYSDCTVQYWRLEKKVPKNCSRVNIRMVKGTAFVESLGKTLEQPCTWEWLFIITVLL